MSLGCTLKEIKQNAFKSVQELVKTNTISMNRDGIIDLNYSKSSKYKTREAAYNVALSIQNKVKSFMSEQLDSKLSDGWTEIIQTDDRVRIQYHFPNHVSDSLNRKFQIEEGREKIEEEVYQARLQQIEDAKRAGVDETEFEDGYMYFQYQEDFDDFMDPDVQERLENAIPNDFSSYNKHKIDLLKRLENKYETYKTLNKNNHGTEKYKADVYSFQNTITKLKDEIENLDLDNTEIMFQDVINELNYLNGILDTTDVEILGNQDVINRIDFLNQMITGQNLDGELVNYDVWNGNSYLNYDTLIIANMTKLTNKLKMKQQQLIKDLLSKDIIFQAHKDKFSEEDIQSLFENMSDINILQELFLGINSNNDSIVATLLNTTFQTNVQKTKQFARPYTEAIKVLDKKLKDKGFELENFFEKDEAGIDTGNIVHKYTKKYFKKLYEYYEINKEFNQAKKDNKAAAYNRKILWLKGNTNVIDFRRIKYFKDIYGDQYNEFFTATDEQMAEYEDMLKGILGKMYDYHIKDLEKKLAEYENYKMNEELKNTKWLNKNINSNSPWIFIQNYLSPNAYEQVEYKSGQNTYFTYNNSKYIEYVPKKNELDVDTDELVPTGYFNDNFDKIENDEDAFGYWESIREVYTKHINPTYSSMGQHISSLSWAKFERSFKEEMSASKGIKGFFKSLYNEAIKSFRQMWYERGYYKEDSGIKGNYTDATNKLISKMKKYLTLKDVKEIQEMADLEGVSYQDLNSMLTSLKEADVKAVTEEFKKDLIDKIARKKVFADYSKDLTKTTLALSDLASLHKTRQETQFIADMLLSYHRTIKDKNNKNRDNSNKKLQSWVSTNIYNERAVSRGNEEDGLGIENNQRFWKYYSDTEKELLKVLESLRGSNVDNTTNFSFFTNEVNYSKKGNFYYITIKGQTTKSDKAEFEEALESYIDSEISRLGIPVTPGGFGMGIMKTIINKALALNPISGIFNRVDGLFANTIRDNMGDYWTAGNLKHAKRFMALANINKFAGEKLNFENKQKALQMKSFQLLLDELALFQDKKNELDRKDKESKFNTWQEKLNMFQFAVDNPEFKNQGEIILSMLMDVIIKDNAGTEYKFFDGSGFPIYKPGTLTLRDEFKNEENQGWEDFHINTNDTNFNQFFVQKLKIEDTIKRTQGNYASLDSIEILDNNWGKFMMLFMRWMPEHVNQRFGTRSVDIIQGKKKIAGRYRGLLKNAGATGIFSSIALGISFGPIGALFGASAAIIPFAIQKWYTKNVYGEKDVQNHLLDMHVSLGFMKEILIQSMNLPLKVGYGKTNLDTIIKNNKLHENPNLSQDEVQALKGMAQEAAIMLTQLMTLMLLKSLLWDNDDEDEDYRRQFHNFVDNQANRSIGNMLNWSNPRTFVDENSKLAMLRYIGDIEKLITHINDYYVKDKGSPSDLMYDFTKIQPFIPVPNSVNKATFKGEVPGLDKKEYKGSQWFDAYAKGEEWINTRQLQNRRSKYKQMYEELIRQKYEGKDIPEERLETMVDKQVRKRMSKLDIKKRKNETATQALERIDFDQKMEDLEEK